MTEKEILNNGVSVANSSTEKQLTKITGILTSQIQLRGEGTKKSYYYSFIRCQGQKIDLPVIFKIKDETGKLLEPLLKKTFEVALTGHYSTSHKNIRKSFTAYSYQLLDKILSLYIRDYKE